LDLVRGLVREVTDISDNPNTSYVSETHFSSNVESMVNSCILQGMFLVCLLQ